MSIKWDSTSTCVAVKDALQHIFHNNLLVHAHVHVIGDEQPSSEDVLDESADEVPVGDNEAAHLHVSDVDSPGYDAHDSHGQLSAEAEDLKQDSGNKGACT